MARYKPVDRHLTKLLPVRFSEQILPGTFEYAVNWLVDHKIDLSVFDTGYCNDDTGASAYDPGVLLKIVLMGYARGLISSRMIEGPAARMSSSWPCRATARLISPPSLHSSLGCRERSLPCSGMS